MDCESTRALLFLLEDELEGPETATLSCHLDACAPCRQAREELLAARSRLLVPRIPAMPAIRLALSPRAARWPRMGLAAAAALLLAAAAWLDGSRMTRRGAAEETLAVRTYRFQGDARAKVVGQRNVPRVRVAEVPDGSWALMHTIVPAATTAGPAASASRWEIGVGGLPPSSPPRMGRISAGRWEMADLVVQTALADRPQEWKTRIRIEDQ